MFIICLDLEGILIPEIWINVALQTGIDELKLTTRDISDYDVLMKKRLQILKEKNITLKDIQDTISKMELLEGAKEFFDWLRTVSQVIILTDSFIEFVMPFMKKLGYPTILCHNLETNSEGMIIDYKLRINNMKKKSVKAFKEMNFDVIAVGDSYNDTEMLKEAKHGILFRPPRNVIEEFSQFPIVTDYSALKQIISDYLGL
ncbi:MAG: bifunctional phosphoserine phosphatase/homoserine phosphotransferase ThrH [Candidatus Helarchaeota archaeon]